MRWEYLMPNRFTETDKWKKPWFRKLAPEYKLLWVYMLDTCDAAGVWPVDTDLASYCIGAPLDEHEAIKVMKKQIVVLAPTKWLIRDFVSFQYGRLSEACNPHKRVFATLATHGLNPDSFTPQGYHGRVPSTLQDKTRQDKTSSSFLGKGDARGETRKQKAMKIYAAHPKKRSRQAALRAIEQQLANGISFDHLLERTQAFAASPRGKNPPKGAPDYRKDPERWYRDACYEDDPDLWEQPNGDKAPQQLGRLHGNKDLYAHL